MMSALIVPGEKAGVTATWQNGRAAVDGWAAQQGEALVRAALRAGGDTCPREMLRPMATLLHAVRGRYARAADAWIVSAVGAPDFPSQSQPCDEDVRRVFCELATRAVNPQVDAGGRRWIAMVVDFFQICLKEADKDALVAHQM